MTSVSVAVYTGAVLLMFLMMVGQGVQPPDPNTNPCVVPDPDSSTLTSFAILGSFLLSWTLGLIATVAIWAPRKRAWALIFAMLLVAASATMGVLMCGFENYSPVSTCIGAVIVYLPWLSIALSVVTINACRSAE